jgi:replicative DNA helicase
LDNAAEIAVLGAVLLDNAVWPQAAALKPSNFYLEANRKIFTRMHGLYAAGKAIDEITLPDELEKQGELESVGGLAYISSLIESTKGGLM